jgi:hypothetical protein
MTPKEGRVVDSPQPDRSVEQQAVTKGTKSQTITLVVLTALMLVAMVALTSVMVAR